MEERNLLNKAIRIATEAHEGQLDRYGQPYLHHLTRVMDRGQSLEEKIIGILHDVVEDSSWTIDQLKLEGFSEEILLAIYCLTKKSNEEDFDAYIQRVTKSPLAVSVKLNDLSDNMDIRRMKIISEPDLVRLNKYLKAFHFLISISEK